MSIMPFNYPNSYDQLHHIEHLDSDGRPTNKFYLAVSHREVYDSEAHPEYGPKTIVSTNAYLFRMIQMTNGVKYLYNDQILAIFYAVSSKYWIKCEEPPQVVIDRFLEALCELFPVNPVSRAITKAIKEVS